MNDEELTKKWACNLRTLQRWRSQGAPLDDDEAMKKWLLSRHRIPPGTARLLRGEPPPTGGPVPPPKPKSKLRPVLPQADGESPSALGAPAALKRLEQAEDAAHKDMLAALADPDATPESIMAARKGWLMLVDSMRRSDAVVEESRRDAGLLVPRSELEDYAQGLIVNFLGSVVGSLERACPQITGLPTPQAVWDVLRPLLTNATNEAVEHTAERPYAGRETPKWLSDAVRAAREMHGL
jgi:hypothetical protein